MFIRKKRLEKIEKRLSELETQQVFSKPIYKYYTNSGYQNGYAYQTSEIVREKISVISAIHAILDFLHLELKTSPEIITPTQTTTVVKAEIPQD